MWIDSDSPGCIYDTIDCNGCKKCSRDLTPLDLYIEEKGDINMDEHIYFKTDDELKSLLLNKIEEQVCKIITTSSPKCTKKSRINKESFESIFTNEIFCVNTKNVVIGANYRDILKRYRINNEAEDSNDSNSLELPWGEWVSGTNVLIFHKDNYYLRVYNVDNNNQKCYIYSNGKNIESNSFKRLDEFLPIEKESLINNIKLSNIKKIEFTDKTIERFE